MKTQGDNKNLPFGSDFDISGSEACDDQENVGSENKKNNFPNSGSVDYGDMGEVIRRWESSRYTN